MQIKRPPIIVIVFAVIALLAGTYYLYNATHYANIALTASGTVEATEVQVNQGDIVKAGDVLFRLDDTLLKAQRNVAASALDTAKRSATTAEAALASAQAQYDIAQNTALGQVPIKQRTSDWSAATQSDFVLPSWYFSQDEQISAAQAAVDSAQQTLADQQANLSKMQASAASADFVKAENDMAEAQANYLVAKRLNDQVSNGKDINDPTRRGLSLLARDTKEKNKGVTPKWLGNNLDGELRVAAQKIFDDARVKLDDSKTAYLDVISSESEGATNVLEARGSVSVAQEHLYRAQDLLRSLQTGNNSPALTAAQKALDQAKSAAEPAESAVGQAQANVDLIDTQLAKLTITAPADGMILTRAVEPGEVVMPGSGLLTMARLSDLTITVYIPEDRYGEISMGQSANVTVDSFPSEKFVATVTYISSKAEFTPRNVQTVEGRKTTVFAIKLLLEDSGGRLKPGMPADVLFK